MLSVGTSAPDFSLQDANGEMVSLSDFRGKKVVLYFYPKDHTAGCTAQSCQFSAMKQEFESRNCQVIGISKDSVSSHQKFAAKFDLNQILLSDPEKTVIQRYEVWKEKSLYGKKYMGVERSTYLIDEAGVIVAALAKVSPSKNAAEVLALLDK